MKFNGQQFIAKKIREVAKVVGRQKAIVACSGGVDSVTCALLAHRVLGNKLLAVFIDDGLMREGEPQSVVKTLRSFGIQTKPIRVSSRFFKALRGKIDPEEKRKAFRETFYRILGEVVKKEKARFLVQGTIKADILETAAGIKTQHNVLEQIGINPQKYGLLIVEPLKDLLKPEVRQLAKALGLPKKVYQRMPFPGPGLAIRIVGEVTPERIAIVRQTTTIVEKELMRFASFQILAVLLSDRATGVKNNKREFGYIIVIRGVDSKDALTATASKIPWESLEKTQREIVKKIPEVCRVLYDLTPKPPATIEYI